MHNVNHCSSFIKRIEKTINSYEEFKNIRYEEREEVKRLLAKIYLIGRVYNNLIFYYNAEIGIPLLDEDLHCLFIYFGNELDEELKKQLKTIYTLKENLNKKESAKLTDALITLERYIQDSKEILERIAVELVSKLLKFFEDKYGYLSNAEKSIILQKLADKLGLSYPYYFLSAISENLDIGQFVERRVNLSKSIRRKVLERDNYQCVKCGSKENLEIHHKIPYSNFLLPRNANKLENLVTLCKKCHQSEHKVEVKVSEEFLKLLKREKERYGLKLKSKTAKKSY